MELLDRFLSATDRAELFELARNLGLLHDLSVVPRLIEALTDPLEARREAAAYYLTYRMSDRRAVRPLIRVLDDSSETLAVRGQAAEALAYSRKRKSVPALIRGSRDVSPEVRFWCVFALGSFVCKRKRPRAVIGALAERLDDIESARGFLANSARSSRHAGANPAAFARELLRASQDPTSDAEKNWANFYH